MSDILIRGRKPPKNCSLCPLSSFGRFGDSCYFGVSQKDGRKRPIDCPFIELPEHGDLIDRSKLSFVCGGTTPMEMDFVRRYVVDGMPVVISASEEKGGV